MTWQFVSKTRRSRSTAPAAQRFRFRPRVDSLEERTLLTIHTFTLDPSQSVLNLSGTLMTPIGNGTLQPQGPGSLTTSYEGTVEIDLTRPNITVIPDNTDVVADISGNWQPAEGGNSGSAPANYGGMGMVSFASALAAVRNFSATASGGPERITGFDPAGLAVYFNSDETLTILSGNVDYSYNASIFGSGHGSQDATGYAAQNQAGNGYIQFDGVSQLTLVEPIYVNYTVTFSTPIGNVTANLIIQGQLVGYANYPSVATGLNLGGLSAGTTDPGFSDGSALHSPVATTGTSDATPVVQAGKPELVTDGTGFHALGSHSAVIDTLAISDGLAVQLFS